MISLNIKQWSKENNGKHDNFMKYRTALRRLANRLETEKRKNEWQFAF